MVVDQTYVDEMEALYERTIMELGKKLIAFYTGRDMGLMAVYNDASVCFNVGRAIRDYDYDLDLITDDDLIKYREILGSLLIKYTKPILYTHVLNEYSEPVPVATPVIYAGTSSGGLILRSVNLGLTFSVFDTSSYGNPTCFTIGYDGKIYCGTDTGYIINLTDNTLFTGLSFYSGRINKILIYENLIIVCHNGGVTYTNNLRNGDVTLTASYYFHDIAPYRSTGAVNPDVFITRDGIRLYQHDGAGGFISYLTAQAGDFRSLCNIGGGVLYAGDSGGRIWKSIDYGATWVDHAHLTTVAIASIIQNNGRIIATDQYSSSTIYYTDDDFATINSVAPMMSGSNYEIIAINDSVLILANGNLAGGNGDIWRSEDNGATWAEIAGNPQQGESSINALIMNLEYL